MFIIDQKGRMDGENEVSGIIITVTIIALSMLYLLQSSYVQQRVGMLAVYRLLGLPKKKILEISLVPVVRLLHLPPARLAAKYDI